MTVYLFNLNKDKKDHAKIIQYVYCGRPSLLGNPFKIKNNSDEERNRVCDLYEKHFSDLVNNDELFKENIDNIVQVARSVDIALTCYCTPLRCHTETIKRYIDNCLNEVSSYFISKQAEYIFYLTETDGKIRSNGLHINGIFYSSKKLATEWYTSIGNIINNPNNDGFNNTSRIKKANKCLTDMYNCMIDY